jgi:PST family polysaccharide transporter
MSEQTQSDRPILAGNTLLAGDSFRLSVLLFVGLTVGQRIIGLVRSTLFCGMLEDHELGRWSIASTFLGWAAPFVVLGLPGSFGRLSEHYRQRGELNTFLRRTSTLCGLLVTLAIAVHLAFPEAIAAIIFNDPLQSPLIAPLGIVLGAVIAMNFLAEFLTSVRLNRAVALMHLTNSLIFTVLGVFLLTADWRPESSLLIAFGSSAASAALVGAIYTYRFARLLPSSPINDHSSNFWMRVAPLAWWIWCGNTISNAFDVSDQYVLKHFVDLPAGTVDAMIGQLFASRFVPVLIVSVAVMVAGSLLPFLIKDCESGKRADAQRRLNSVIRYAAIGFTVVAGFTHILSPVLFTWLLRGKYDSGLHLMPLAFVQYTWFSLSVIGNTYLICSDRPRIALIPPLLGLITSVTLTSTFAPTFGLVGVAWSTMAANGIELIGLFVLTAVAGMKWDRSTLIAVAIPISLAFGGVVALSVTAAVLLASVRSNWMISAEEREEFFSVVRGFCAKFPLTIPWLTNAGRVTKDLA